MEGINFYVGAKQRGLQKTEREVKLSVEIEVRPYGPESTEEERQAIKDRVYLYSDRIVIFKETPIQTIFQIDLSFEKIEEITQELESFSLIIDLSEAKPPTAEIREHLKKCYSSLDRMLHAAVVTERNFMLNIAAKFVLKGLGLKSYSIHKTMGEALGAVHDKEQV